MYSFSLLLTELATVDLQEQCEFNHVRVRPRLQVRKERLQDAEDPLRSRRAWLHQRHQRDGAPPHCQPQLRLVVVMPLQHVHTTVCVPSERLLSALLVDGEALHQGFDDGVVVQDGVDA